MTGMILGIILISLLVLFSICSCMAISWSKQEMMGGFGKWKKK